jgi:cation diffusion facilitator family transporter
LETSKINIRTQQWVAALSVVLLTIKVVAYYVTNSVAILTDALEGIVNIVAGFVGLYSLYISAKPRDEDHPYGHGKVEFVSAALEGAMIFTTGFIIAFQSLKNLISPEPLHALDTGMILIGIAAVANYILGAVCIRIGRRNQSMALHASGKHLQSDTYTTAGIIVGLFIVYLTGIQWLDSLTAIIFAGLIVWTGYKILRSSLAGIMDESDRDLLKKMVILLNEHRRDNWMDLHNVRIIKYGNVLHVDGHLTVPWYLNVNEAHHELDEFISLVSSRFGNTMEFFIHTDGCVESSCQICHKKDCPVRQHNFQKNIVWTVENISQNKKHDVMTAGAGPQSTVHRPQPM